MKLDKKYKTYVLWQDAQHSQLINLLDDLTKGNKTGADPKLFTYTTAFLVMYVTHHFNLEEEYMETYDYPEKDFHIAEHHKYIAMLKEFRKTHTQFSQEGSKILEESILAWIMNHIMVNDQKLGAFIRDKEKELMLAKDA